MIAKYATNGYIDILQEKWYGGLPCFKLATDMAQPRPLGVAAVAGKTDIRLQEHLPRLCKKKIFLSSKFWINTKKSPAQEVRQKRDISERRRVEGGEAPFKIETMAKANLSPWRLFIYISVYR